MTQTTECERVRREQMQERLVPVSSEASRSARQVWVDAARGLGIILVVLGHALGGMIDAGRTPPSDWFRPLFLTIYAFHMPLFFMLSGLFVMGRVEKQGRSFVPGVLRSIALPYFLWSAVQLTVIASAGGVVNAPVADYWRDIAMLPFTPVSQFWFLYALVLLHAASALALPRFGPVGFILLCVCLSSFAQLHLLPDILQDTGSMAPFYAFGVWMGSRLHDNPRPLARPALFALQATAVAAVALIVVRTRAGMGESFAVAKAAALAHVAFGFPFLFASLPAALAVALTLASLPHRAGAALPYLGRHSLSIYVLHVMFVAGSRIAMTKLLGIDGPIMLVGASVAVGLAGPLIVFEIARRLRLEKTLGLS